MKLRPWFFALGFVLSPLLSGQATADYTVTSLGQKIPAQVWMDPWRGVALVETSNRMLTLDFRTGIALGDGESEMQLTPLVDSPQGPKLSKADFQKLLDWFSSAPDRKASTQAVTAPEAPARQGTSQRVQVIVLDAGHGGTDPGSIGRHQIGGKDVVLQEKDLTLAVVLEANRLLKETLPDRTIVLTRDHDTYPTLEERVKLADAQKLGPHDSILFLSVHFNASLNKTASGLEFWYVPQDYDREVIASKDVPQSVFPVLNTMVDQEFKKESQDLARDLASGLAKELGDDKIQRGLKENPWFVVRMARMPAVLAELGFITNPDEAAKFTDPEYLKKLARGLYTGLVSFIKTYEDLP